jgi:phage tail-like protein
VACGPHGETWLLWRDVAGAGWAQPVADPRTDRVRGPFTGATDLDLDGAGDLVVAGPAGTDLRRFALGADTEDTPLRAGRYDGRGIARTPTGRIGYWSARPRGPREAFPAPVVHGTEGTVQTFVLDAGAYRQRWGRIYVDACLPSGTGLSVASHTADDLPAEEGLPSVPPAAPANTRVPDRPGPPLPATDAFELADEIPVYRRGDSEVPWHRHTDELVTYEAPVNAPPGRYLWLRWRLTGTRRAAPRIRAVRVEVDGHRLTDRLPRVYTEDAGSAAFLDRYLAVLDGPLAGMTRHADARHVLVDPAAAPPELLPWLASLVGLTLDERWPEPARRTMIAEAVPLFRRRGTVGALVRMLEIYLGVAPVLVERFRFRGTGPTGLLDLTGAAAAPAAEDRYAHRFSVVVPRWLTAEQNDVVGHLLDLHRPAHTLVEVCTAGTGMRVGLGLHLELTSVVGRTGAFGRYAVGGAPGPATVLGQPSATVKVGAGRLGYDTRVQP